jgi:mannose/fructose/N-acetylgalactosamine-specific phosphotransferase system component IIC
VHFKNDSTQVAIDVAITQAAISAAIHLILSFWMLTYGLRMYFFLTSSQTMMNADTRKEHLRAIRRVLLVAITFALCYLIRSICVAMVVMHYLEVIEVYAYFSDLAWFLISQWIPFLIPVRRYSNIA